MWGPRLGTHVRQTLIPREEVLPSIVGIRHFGREGNQTSHWVGQEAEEYGTAGCSNMRRCEEHLAIAAMGSCATT